MALSYEQINWLNRHKGRPRKFEFVSNCPSFLHMNNSINFSQFINLPNRPQQMPLCSIFCHEYQITIWTILFLFHHQNVLHLIHQSSKLNNDICGNFSECFRKRFVRNGFDKCGIEWQSFDKIYIWNSISSTAKLML